jgi:hypothetical protein
MPLLDAVPMRYLPLNEYIEDYGRVSRNLDGDIWKSERAQDFREPGNPSWESFISGRWDEALECANETLPELTDYFSELATSGFHFYRLRVVEPPLTQYLHWELHVLQVRVKAGERIRIALPEIVEPAESVHGRIPELVLLGKAVGYVVDYGQDGTPRGAHRFVDAGVIAECRSIVEDLYARSEDLSQFFAREVEPLEPPVGE